METLNVIFNAFFWIIKMNFSFRIEVGSDLQFVKAAF